jgi:hypothetical protein
VQNHARKLNQTAVVAEKKRAEAPGESRGVSKQKWYEEKKKRIGKELEASGLDMKQAYMLDTVEDAEDKYKKWEKKETPFGWDGEYQRPLLCVLVPHDIGVYRVLPGTYLTKLECIESCLEHAEREQCAPTAGLECWFHSSQNVLVASLISIAPT